MPRERHSGGAGKAGWAQLFLSAFRQSRNPMVLLDDGRRHVEVNGAYLQLVGYPRMELMGRPIVDIVQVGVAMTEEQWRAAIARGDVHGHSMLVRADGQVIGVDYAAHTEIVTGKCLVLVVALHTSRRRRPTSRRRDHEGIDALTERELEVVQLVAHGNSGPEIAHELHISHATVRTHVRNAQKKAGARTRAQLVAMALGEGHVGPRDHASAVST